jgi:thioredoxin 2
VIACSARGKRNRVPPSAAGSPRCAICHQDLLWLVDAADDGSDTIIAGRLPVLVDLCAPW